MTGGVTPSLDTVADDVPVDYGIHAPYIAALRAVLEMDEGALAACIDATPDILETLYQGWPLLHHIALMDWTDGITVYRQKNGRIDIKSEDAALRFGGGAIGVSLCQVGGQTLLHVIALNRSREELESKILEFPEANTADYNERMPCYYLGRRDIPIDDKALVIARVAQQSRIILVRDDRYPVNLNEGLLMDGVRCFEVPPDACASLISEIAVLDQSIPNSMHRYGKILLPQMQSSIHNLVAHVLPADDAQRVSRIHAFYVQYSELVGQRSLDSHIDDSHWTINLCLSVSPDLRGSELVFDPQNVEYRHTHAGRGIIHKGNMRHHVQPLVCGQRENIIVWVTLAPQIAAAES